MSSAKAPTDRSCIRRRAAISRGMRATRESAQNSWMRQRRPDTVAVELSSPCIGRACASHMRRPALCLVRSGGLDHARRDACNASDPTVTAELPDRSFARRSEHLDQTHLLSAADSAGLSAQAKLKRRAVCRSRVRWASGSHMAWNDNRSVSRSLPIRWVVPSRTRRQPSTRGHSGSRVFTQRSRRTPPAPVRRSRAARRRRGTC